MVISVIKNYYYLDAISTIRREDIKGIGTLMIQTLINDARNENNIDFIMLTPVKGVTGFYKRNGFIEYPVDRDHLYYPITRDVTDDELFEFNIKYQDDKILKRRLKDLLKKLNRDEKKILKDYLENNPEELGEIISAYNIQGLLYIESFLNLLNQY